MDTLVWNNLNFGFIDPWPASDSTTDSPWSAPSKKWEVLNQIKPLETKRKAYWQQYDWNKHFQEIQLHLTMNNYAKKDYFAHCFQ